MRAETEKRTFRYTARWHAYAALIAGVAALFVVEGAVIDVLIVILVHATPVRAVLLGTIFLLHVLVLAAIFLPPLLTCHHLSATDLSLRYGYDRLVIPRAALVAARPAREPVDLLGPVRAQTQGDRGRIVAVFSPHGQVVLTLDHPRWLRMNGSEGDVTSILINVDRRDDFLAALGLPTHRSPQVTDTSARPSVAGIV